MDSTQAVLAVRMVGCILLTDTAVFPYNLYVAGQKAITQVSPSTRFGPRDGPQLEIASVYTLDFTMANDSLGPCKACDDEEETDDGWNEFQDWACSRCGSRTTGAGRWPTCCGCR